MRNNHDPHGLRLPIKLDTTTNGEFAPIPLEPVHHHALSLARQRTAECAKRTGQSRRTFLVSACGAAATLLAFNAAFAAGGRRGGFYDLSADASMDLQLARSQLDSRRASRRAHTIPRAPTASMRW